MGFEKIISVQNHNQVQITLFLRYLNINRSPSKRNSKYEMKSKATRRVLRCPHILEVFASYGFIFIMMQYICAVKLQSPITQQIALTIIGLFVYSFLEYIFHRVILHIWLKTIHDNHHARPAYLHIIGTPIIPVFLYGFFFSSILMLLFGNQYAWAMNRFVVLLLLNGDLTFD